MAEIFEFDDFFVPEDDKGIEEKITVHGREVPIFMKRGITLGDVEAAKAKAIQQHITPAGALEVTGIDQSILNSELMLRCIKSWPFTRKGKPVPITSLTINQIRAEAGAELQTLITRYTSGVVNKESVDAFAARSEQV